VSKHPYFSSKDRVVDRLTHASDAIRGEAEPRRILFTLLLLLAQPLNVIHDVSVNQEST